MKKISRTRWSRFVLGFFLLIVICSLTLMVVIKTSLNNDVEYVQTKQLDATHEDFDSLFKIAEVSAREWNSNAMLKLANGTVTCQPGNPIDENRGMLFFFVATQFYFGTSRLAMARVTIDSNDKMSIVAGPSQMFGWPGLDPEQMSVDLYEAISLTQSSEKVVPIIQQPDCKIEFFLSNDIWDIIYDLNSVEGDDKIRFEVNIYTGEVHELEGPRRPK